MYIGHLKEVGTSGSCSRVIEVSLTIFKSAYTNTELFSDIVVAAIHISCSSIIEVLLTISKSAYTHIELQRHSSCSDTH